MVKNNFILDLLDVAPILPKNTGGQWRGDDYLCSSMLSVVLAMHVSNCSE